MFFFELNDVAIIFDDSVKNSHEVIKTQKKDTKANLKKINIWKLFHFLLQ